MKFKIFVATLCLLILMCFTAAIFSKKISTRFAASNKIQNNIVDIPSSSQNDGLKNDTPYTFEGYTAIFKIISDRKVLFISFPKDKIGNKENYETQIKYLIGKMFKLEHPPLKDGKASGPIVEEFVFYHTCFIDPSFSLIIAPIYLKDDKNPNEISGTLMVGVYRDSKEIY